MRMKSVFAIALVLIAVATLAVVYGSERETKEPAPVPAAPASHKDLIVLESPLPGAFVTSPLTLTGRARGNWYFEATFPISMVDWDGRIIAEGYATAQGDWMTTEYVPFTATLTFPSSSSTQSYSDRGALILRKDNPSALPEYDDAMEVWIRY